MVLAIRKSAEYFISNMKNMKSRTVKAENRNVEFPIKIVQYISPLWFSTNTDFCSHFLINEEESQHPLCSFYCKPSREEKKGEERKEETERGGKKRKEGREDRRRQMGKKRQVRKDRRKEEAERRGRGDAGKD